jgi:hypothetical protein
MENLLSLSVEKNLRCGSDRPSADALAAVALFSTQRPTNDPFDYCSITTGSFVEEITILSDVILSEKQEGDWMSGRAAGTLLRQPRRSQLT